MLDPLSDAGAELHDRTARRFVRRLPAVLADPLDDADPDVVRAAVDAVASPDPPQPSLTDWEWTVVASAAYGPGLSDVAPGPFRRLALAHLVDPDAPDALDDRAERLLVCKALQAHDWETVTEVMAFHSRRSCMLAFGDAYEPLVDHYGNERAREIRSRYLEGDPD